MTLLVLVLLALQCLAFVVLSYHAVVNELKEYVETNTTFAELVNKTFDEAGYGPDSDDPMSYDRMYVFFDSWIPIIGNYSNMTFYYQFYDFAYNSETGYELIREQKSQSWLLSYCVVKKNFADSIESTSIVPVWEDWKVLNMSQYVVPPNGFQSFNDFFTRNVKPGERPIADPNDNNVLVSPVDGQFNILAHNLSLDGTYVVKNVWYNLEKMLGSTYYAQQFAEGTAVQFSLDTYNYHRFHAAIGGIVQKTEIHDGFVLVQPNSKTEGYLEYFANNNVRAIVYMETAKFGLVAQIHVGMYLYSSVTFEEQIVIGSEVKKGEKIGHFKYGGSTVLLLFKEGMLGDVTVDLQDYVQVGQKIGSSS